MHSESFHFNMIELLHCRTRVLKDLISSGSIRLVIANCQNLPPNLTIFSCQLLGTLLSLPFLLGLGKLSKPSNTATPPSVSVPSHLALSNTQPSFLERPLSHILPQVLHDISARQLASRTAIIALNTFLLLN